MEDMDFADAAPPRLGAVAVKDREYCTAAKEQHRYRAG